MRPATVAWMRVLSAAVIGALVFLVSKLPVVSVYLDPPVYSLASPRVYH